MIELAEDIDIKIKASDFTQTSTLNYEKQQHKMTIDDDFVDLQMELHKLGLM